MNQGTNWLLLMKKNRSKKSRASAPLSSAFVKVCSYLTLANITTASEISREREETRSISSFLVIYDNVVISNDLRQLPSFVC
jgi:hypothetical protein